MTFHVRYNDCHLKANMERERAKERSSYRRMKRDKRRGQKEEKEGNHWMKMVQVTSGSDQMAQPNHRLPFWKIHLPDLYSFLSSLCCSLKLSPSFRSVSIFPAGSLHSFAINGSLAALRQITRWIAQSETPYILFRVGHDYQRPELSAVTWASSWLSFTLPFLMRPDS